MVSVEGTYDLHSSPTVTVCMCSQDTGNFKGVFIQTSIEQRVVSSEKQIHVCFSDT